MPLPLHHIFSTLQDYPELYAKTEFQDVIRFAHLAVLLKPYLMVSRSFYVDGPVERLPAYMHGFLIDALGLDDEVAKLLWETLKHWIWEQEWNERLQRELGNEYIPYFLKHGTNRDLSKPIHPHAEA